MVISWTAVADTRRTCWMQPPGDTLQLPDSIVRRGGRAADGTGLESRSVAWPIISAISVTWPHYIPGSYLATVIQVESR